jgi:hypothetical protein
LKILFSALRDIPGLQNQQEVVKALFAGEKLPFRPTVTLKVDVGVDEIIDNLKDSGLYDTVNKPRKMHVLACSGTPNDSRL